MIPLLNLIGISVFNFKIIILRGLVCSEFADQNGKKTRMFAILAT